MYCIDSEENSVPTVYFHLCRLSCDRDCRYYITEMCLVALFTSLLLPHVSHIFKLPKRLRPGIDGWTQLCCMCQCALYHSWYWAHQHTILLSWVSYVACMYYHWLRIESASPLSLIQSTYSLLMELIMMLMSASACLRFGGLKSFLSFLVSMLFLYYLSDYISLPFTMRVITVLCVWFVSARSVTLLKLLILLLLAGAGLDRVSILVWLKCLEHQKLPTSCNNKYI